MQLAPSAEQQALKDAVRRFCDQQVTPQRLAAWEREPNGVTPDCWRQVAALGWLGLGLPTPAGGSDRGLVEVACLLEECARGLIPRRIANAVRGGVALAALDPGHRCLPALCSGASSVALGLDEEHARTPTAYRTRVSERNGTPRLTGEKWYVPSAAQADLHLIAAREQEGISLVLAPAAAARITPLRSFDGEPQAVVCYDDVPVERLTPAAAGAVALERLWRQQQALALAEMVGGMDAVLATTVAYVKEREQFGQKIAVFQAVQHQVADTATLLTAARHLAWQAITRLSAGTLAGEELACALAFVGQAFKRATLTAHHLHGGAGYVVEHPLHYHAERAQSLCIRYAPEGPALDAVAGELLGP